MARRDTLTDLPGFEGDEGPDDQGGPTLLHWASLVLGSVRRRPRLFVAVLLGGLACSLAYYLVRAPVYRVETRVLAQRLQSLPSITRGTTPDDVPTRSAWELVHRRENLVAIIKENKLAPPPGGKESVGLWTRIQRAFSDLGSSANDDDAMNALVARLNAALNVTTAEGTVTISVEWPDPQQAYHIVETALQNFLEARQLQEITAIDEAISLMAGRVSTLRANLLAEEAREMSRSADGASRLRSLAASSRTTVVAPNENLARVKSLLDAKERSIRDMEEFRRRRLLDLQSQLEEKRGVYSDAHPSVISLRKEVDALSLESPQIAALREEEKALREEYAVLLAAEGHPRPAGAATTDALPPPVRIPSLPGGAEVSERLRDARSQYQQMVERLNEAQLALDTSRAAFKYRYSVVWPAQVPRDPVSPNPVRVFGAGALLSLLVAFAAVSLVDVRRGTIVERWQVERTLGLPVLGEIGRR
jgi:uncharacterized protein involved in exopolysaccharide biosynthesis